MPEYGVASMVAPLKRVMIATPRAFPAGASWQAFNYANAPDDARAKLEHAAFREHLEPFGCEVVTLEGHDPSLQDAIFTYDPSIVTPFGAIVARMGKVLREPEPDLHAAMYARLGIPVIGRIEAPGTLEGGDTLWLDAGTLVVGRGHRTNAAGIAQLRHLLEPRGVRVTAVDLPNLGGARACLHLMSLVNMLDDDLAAVLSRFLPVALVELLESRGVRLVPMPEDEFDTQGNNILALAPRRVLMAEGNPKSIAAVRGAGCEVTTYAGEEISKNREGGPTCLTRPLWRAAG